MNVKADMDRHKKLYKARLDSGLTIIEIAEMAGITPKSYRWIECKKQCPTLKSAMALVEVFGCERIEDLFDMNEIIDVKEIRKRKRKVLNEHSKNKENNLE